MGFSFGKKALYMPTKVAFPLSRFLYCTKNAKASITSTAEAKKRPHLCGSIIHGTSDSQGKPARYRRCGASATARQATTTKKAKKTPTSPPKKKKKKKKKKKIMMMRRRSPRREAQNGGIASGPAGIRKAGDQESPRLPELPPLFSSRHGATIPKPVRGRRLREA
ncbi:hypothetical protein [uncultured Bilophila sp.]|uniref:hypothetical protein n=1 Tax=uncultured Bilophila sp. TaxID=529385 RepID=UPI00261F8238|nr:hypothetical protein [uncultured Bilophila sp.]